jgi:hypothetical protein
MTEKLKSEIKTNILKHRALCLQMLSILIPLKDKDEERMKAIKWIGEMSRSLSKQFEELNG